MSGDSPRLSFTGVVLAGGRSRRFGEANKAVAVVDGTTFVERVARAVRAASDNSPVIAVNSDDQRATVERGLDSGLDPTFALDAASFEGPLSGLYGSLRSVETEWLFLTGCDMPRLSPAAIAWLADRLRRTDSLPDALVPVDSEENPEPLHGFYRRDAVAEARGDLRANAGLRALLDALSDPETVPIRATPSEVPLAASLQNVNTKREHRRMRRAVER